MQTTYWVKPELPRSGLGNMLLVWARAVLFAELNQLPLIAPRWNHWRLGPWLRGERDKRRYDNFFSARGCISESSYWLHQFGSSSYQYDEPTISQLNFTSPELQRPGCHTFVFSQMPHWSDYFFALKDYQPLIKKKLFGMVQPKLMAEIVSRPVPEISLHIRLGDFRQVQTQQEFAEYHFACTPLDWFIDTLQRVRKVAGWDIPATVFTDGYAYEVTSILKLPNVSLASPASALSDLLTLSRSKLLIASSHSTFSAWGAYLGQCPTLWHPTKAEAYQTVFSSDVSSKIYEGGFVPKSLRLPALLIDNIESMWMQNSRYSSTGKGNAF